MANISVPKSGGSIRISGVSSPTAHTITVGELPSYATASTVGNAKIITLPENTYVGRTFTLEATGVTASDPAYQGTATITSSWTVTQAGNSISITSSTPIDATATTLNYTVVATSACRVRLTGSPLPSFIQNDHPAGQHNGSFTIPANTHSYAEYYSLNAWILENVSVSDIAQVEQAAYQKYVVGVTVSNVQQITDIPATGGTATYQNFSYTVTLNYSDGTTDDITSTADMTESTTVTATATTASTREVVGVINITATYYDGPNPFTSTVTANVYQAALNTKLNLLWQNGIFQNNTNYVMGVNTGSQFIVCEEGSEGTSLTTQGTVSSRSTGTLYYGNEGNYPVSRDIVWFQLEEFPRSVTPFEYDNCYITLTFSQQGANNKSISWSTVNPPLLLRLSVDLSGFSSDSNVLVTPTINFVVNS